LAECEHLWAALVRGAWLHVARVVGVGGVRCWGVHACSSCPVRGVRCRCEKPACFSVTPWFCPHAALCELEHKPHGICGPHHGGRGEQDIYQAGALGFRATASLLCDAAITTWRCGVPDSSLSMVVFPPQCATWTSSTSACPRPWRRGKRSTSASGRRSLAFRWARG
jgi:hypothetical protein